MLEAIAKFFGDLTSGDENTVTLEEDDLRLASAALLYHLIAIDGEVSDGERQTLAELLKRRFDLDPAAVGSLIDEARSADNEAVDLYQFTSVLKRRLDAADRERIIKMMWELVYADGTVHEFEDNLVWRVAELLGVTTQTRIRLKQAVRDHDDHHRR
jgi:uncharacterized tellurite resistance protein B-like protein